MEFRQTKAAWIRDPDAPAGKPALGHFDCPCGSKVEGVEFGGLHRACDACGQVFDGRGWLISAPASTELAAAIEASPRFRSDSSRYFGELAARYGRDFTGLAWMQAILKAGQDPGRVA